MIEVIIVITIFSIVGAGLVGSFFSGMKIWNRAKNMHFENRDIVLSLEKIARQIRQSIDNEDISFKGTQEEYSFPAFSANSIVEVNYKFDPFSGLLLRRETDLSEIIAARQEEGYLPKSIESKLLTAEQVSFSYLYFNKEEKNYVWVTEWQENDGIALGVKLAAVVDGKVFEKTIFLPIAI